MLVKEGHLVRVWRLTAPGGESRVLGLYRAGDRAELDRLLEALPLYEWMRVTVMPLEPHPNDPGAMPATALGDRFSHERSLPDPRLTRIFRLEATLGQPLDLGETIQGQRRIVPWDGGTFAGPELTVR